MCKTCSGFEQLGLTTLPSVASPFAGRSPATPRSASWPPRRVLWRIPSKFPPFSRSFAVPRARKGGLQARQAHQKAFSSRDLQGCKGQISTFAFLDFNNNLRVVRAGVPSATYLMVVRGAQSLRLSMLARFCEPAQSSHRRCSQRPLNHADAQRFLAPSPKAQSPTTNLALSSTRGTRGTRQADPLDPTALVYAYV